MSSCWTGIDVFLLEKNIWLWKMSSCWRRKYSYSYSHSYYYSCSCSCSCFYFSCSCLVLALLMLVKTFEVCPPACRRRLFSWKNEILWKNIFLKMRKNYFLWKIVKNTTFELLDHHHELNQKKLMPKEFFMFKMIVLC